VPRGVLALLGCTALVGTPCVAEIFQTGVQAEVSRHVPDTMEDERADERTEFDIPPQSLMTALRAYSVQTGVSVLFDDGMVRDLSSPGVTGNYSPHDALQQLLQGTGLAARYASPMAFTLMPDRSPISARSAPDPVDVAESTRFAGRVQAGLERTLCGSALTRPGNYRLAMQLWLDASGRVTRTRLLGSTGNPARDARIELLLDGLILDGVPPGMPEPLTVLLTPRPLDHPFDCARFGQDENNRP